MAAEDYIDEYDWPEDYETGSVQCKHCKRCSLYWESARDEHNRKRWVLMEPNGSIHNCPAMSAASADEFEDLTNEDHANDSAPPAHRSVNRPGHAGGARKQANRRATGSNVAWRQSAQHPRK